MVPPSILFALTDEPTPLDISISFATIKLTDMSKTAREFFKDHKRIFIDLLLAVILILTGVLAFYLYRQYWSYFSGSPLGQFFVTSRRSASSTPAPLATLPPPRPLPSGKQVYNYSSNNVSGPVPSQVTIDPLTPAVGATQTIFVKIKYSSPVTQANVNLYTDDKVTTYPLQLSEGTNTDGTWKGTWSMPGSYDHTYYIKFDIRSATGNYQQGLMFR